MKKFLSTKYSAAAFNFGMLILRVGLGLLVASHGYDKLVHFNKYAQHFMNFMGLGSSVSLALVVFAEFFCAIFLILGLFTRLTVIPIIIVMTVALFQAHKGLIFTGGEKAAMFLFCGITILLCGPGRISIDGTISK
ncbi:MAG: DoxX family protein [Ginsengibacter sp.]